MDNKAKSESHYAVSWTDEFGADQLTLFPATDKGLADAHVCFVLMSQEEPQRNPEMVHVTKGPVPVPPFQNS